MNSYFWIFPYKVIKFYSSCISSKIFLKKQEKNILVQ